MSVGENKIGETDITREGNKRFSNDPEEWQKEDSEDEPLYTEQNEIGEDRLDELSQRKVMHLFELVASEAENIDADLGELSESSMSSEFKHNGIDNNPLNETEVKNMIDSTEQDAVSSTISILFESISLVVVGAAAILSLIFIIFQGYLAAVFPIVALIFFAYSYRRGLSTE